MKGSLPKGRKKGFTRRVQKNSLEGIIVYVQALPLLITLIHASTTPDILGVVLYGLLRNFGCGGSAFRRDVPSLRNHLPLQHRAVAPPPR